MPRRRDEEEEDNQLHDSIRKRRRTRYEDDDEEEDEDYHDSRKHKKRSLVSHLFQEEADVAGSDEEEEEEEAEEGFINDGFDEEPLDSSPTRTHRRPSFLPREEDDEDDVEQLERQVHERFAKRSWHRDYNDDDAKEAKATEVEQQAFLPSVRDPKLWLVRCAIGCERKLAFCLMQKFITKGLQTMSAIALDHLKGYLYVEAEKEAHVREACKGFNSIYSAKIVSVPIKEMTGVVSVKSKPMDISEGTWVRIKIGVHKDDLAKVVDIDNVNQKVTVKVIPRIDLHALANKLDGLNDWLFGTEAVKKNANIRPPKRFMNIDEAREMRIRVQREKDRYTGDYYDKIDGMRFKDGFLYKTVSMKSISLENIEPTLEELEKFSMPSDMDSLSNLLVNRKSANFRRGDSVVVVKGDLQNLMGWVEKVDEETVHLKSERKDLPKTLMVNEKDLCKYFKPGDQVKVVSGAHESVTGMVFKVEGKVLHVVSDTTKEDIRVFADSVMESIEVKTSLVPSPNVPKFPGKLARGEPRTASGGTHKVGRGRDSLIGTTVKVVTGPFKGYCGRVKDIVTVKRNQISDNLAVTAPSVCETPRYGQGSETPMRYVRTPLRSCTTPMRDPGATPSHGDMRTPMHDTA